MAIRQDEWSLSNARRGISAAKRRLVGDAAHAIVPFFGQGMNCGFEDCAILDDLLRQTRDWEEVFERFSRNRKLDSDAIADMAVENFIEMRDKVGGSPISARKASRADFAARISGAIRFSLFAGDF